MKYKHEVLDILLQCSNILAFIVFIELYDSSLGVDLTLGGSSMRSLIISFQCVASLLPQPSNPISNIQSIVSYFCVMALPRHTSNKLQNQYYNKIPFQKVQFLPTTFDGNVLFELPHVFSTTHRPSQMQGMDRKYDGHVWCKVITINIKNNFGLSFKKVHCLGHLQCLHDD